MHAEPRMQYNVTCINIFSNSKVGEESNRSTDKGQQKKETSLQTKFSDTTKDKINWYA